ncbi:MAG: hypothetical protein GXY13_09930 [Acidimicrobiales bacterium]|nr:hypothetical protein [Acidimicrobiales bacterium]
MGMKGKWAQGIRPRNFSWVIKDRFAVCERPGGYGANHRRVRRQEEIIWVREQGFTKVISLIPANHNLHNYTELEVDWLHWPLRSHDEPAPVLAGLFPQIEELLGQGEKILLHGDELGDRIAGIVAAYVIWSGLVSDAPKATMLVERMLTRQIGPQGRELIALAPTLPGARV